MSKLIVYHHTDCFQSRFVEIILRLVDAPVELRYVDVWIWENESHWYGEVSFLFEMGIAENLFMANSIFPLQSDIPTKKSPLHDSRQS